ncbi:MAG TPA: GTPase Era [Gemmatimonadales bacterium]
MCDENSTAQTRCGIVVLAGKPNAGKSTLVNRLVGETLAIISPKPQTTRQAVVGILSEDLVQLALVDPPGLLDPRYLMQESMVAEALAWLQRADAVLYLHPITDGPPAPLDSLLPDGATLRAPILNVLTKRDLAGPQPMTASDRVAISASTGEGIPALLDWCRSAVPAGPFRFPVDDVSTQPTRFFVAEFVRETAFHLLGDELPYVIATEVDEFREGSEPLYIRVTLYVERESQKGIVIGTRGRTIKALGERARASIERFIGAPVYLDLWVKTYPRWRHSAEALRRFGFSHVTVRE